MPKVPDSELTIEEAEQLIFERTSDKSGRYYGSVHADLGLGVGLIYDGVRYPLYKPEDGIFQTAKGTVLVLTHECDIEPGNEKLFNEDVLVSPLVPLRNVLQALNAKRQPDEVRGYIGDLTAGRISQLMYLPHFTDRFPNGSVLFLNRISHTNYSEFFRDGASLMGSLTGFGLEQLDHKLEAHLLRPKQDRLPLT